MSGRCASSRTASWQPSAGRSTRFSRRNLRAPAKLSRNVVVMIKGVQMTETTIEGRGRTDLAFAGNRRLSTFSDEHRELLEPSGDTVKLEVGEHIQTRGSDVEWSYFPYGTTMVSLVVVLADGKRIEVASIGCEGAIGGIVSCGHAPAFGDAVVQVAGPALRVPMKVLEDAKGRSDFIA